MSELKSFLFRLVVTLLFLAVPILGVWTFVAAEEWGMWFPPMVSTFGGEIDHLFDVIMWMVAITFVATEGLLVYCIFRFSRKDASRAEHTHGNHTLELVWTAVPAVLLVFIAFSQMGAWNKIKIDLPNGPDDPYTPEAPMMEIWASQFDWRARYPSEDGDFLSQDCIESPHDVFVPVNTKVVFRLRSRDVLHSFFVPEFRLKQDAVPGMSIPMWFEATQTGSYDLICAELCGWGHYKMAGKVHVLEQDEYEAWLSQARADLYDNGSED